PVATSHFYPNSSLTLLGSGACNVYNRPYADAGMAVGLRGRGAGREPGGVGLCGDAAAALRVGGRPLWRVGALLVGRAAARSLRPPGLGEVPVHRGFLSLLRRAGPVAADYAGGVRPVRGIRDPGPVLEARVLCGLEPGGGRGAE